MKELRKEEKGVAVITRMVKDLYVIGRRLEPFMPATSAAILTCIVANKMPAQPLFMRK